MNVKRKISNVNTLNEYLLQFIAGYFNNKKSAMRIYFEFCLKIFLFKFLCHRCWFCLMIRHQMFSGQYLEILGRHLKV